jgi:peptidyl-prolyl cis-trans isomerase SurA
MPRPRRLLAFAFGLTASLAVMPDAKADKAVLLDKYVAVVDGITILRSDVLAQAKPFVSRIPEPEKHADDIQRIYKELLERMIDDLVVGQEARKMGLDVRDDEVERAIDLVAAENKATRADIDREVKKQGLTMEDYKLELRRQIIDAKWTSMRVRPRVGLAPPAADKPQDQQAFMMALEAERKKVVAELRQKSHVEVRW